MAKDHDEIAEAFGRRLRAIRKAKGLTQQELADQLGMKLQAVSRLESGGRSPSFETLLRLAEKLGVGLDAFHPDAELEPENPAPEPERPRGKRK